MPYLDPPPFPAPVIVQKDVGGLVSEYQAMTDRYRAEGREVRLHECRSACTLALSLPNVCVYPTSLLKFHKAYNQITRETDEGVSSQLFSSYPRPVQARLGGLTREYRVLTGQELIALGVRNCADGETQIARVQPRDLNPTPTPAVAYAPATPDVGSSVSGFFKTVVAALSPQQTERSPAPTLQRPSASFVRPQTAAVPASTGVDEKSATGVEDIPVPPRRPAELEQPVQLAMAGSPVRRQESLLPSPGLPRLITGAQPVLPAGFVAYASLR